MVLNLFCVAANLHFLCKKQMRFRIGHRETGKNGIHIKLHSKKIDLKYKALS